MKEEQDKPLTAADVSAVAALHHAAREGEGEPVACLETAGPTIASKRMPA